MKNKISFKLIFLIFLISFAITCISVYIQISNQYENKIAKFENNLDKVKENLIPMLSQSLWSVDNIAVDIFLNNLINNENIIYAKVLEDDGSIISVGKIKEFNVIKKEFDINKTIDSKMYKIGKLTVIADLSPLLKELKNNTIGILFTEIVKMLLI